jgi:hypothetical protein
VLAIRERENEELKSSAYYSATAFISQCGTFLVSLFTFATYVLIDDNNVLDAKKAFVSLTLFNIMKMPLAILPQIITNIVQVKIYLSILADLFLLIQNILHNLQFLSADEC